MKFKKLLCLFLIRAFISITLVIPVRANGKLVEDLQITGYRSVVREQILEKIKTRAGELYREEQVKKDFQRLLEMGVFDNPHCKIIIKEGPRGGKIVIFALKEISKK